MPSIRIGLGTDLNLTSELVGINSTSPTTRLDVRGSIRADNTAGSGGISTFTSYDGFLTTQQRLANNITINQPTKGNLNSLSGEIVIADGKEVTVSSGTSIAAGRLDSLTVTASFDLPHGGTAQRDKTPEKGTTRFNEDLGTIEFYTGVEWRPVGAFDGSGRGRGVFGGGFVSPVTISTISYINISSTGNAQDFGNLATARQQNQACSSETRGLFAGGYNPTFLNTIEYITIASQGNGISFGSLVNGARRRMTDGGLSSSTRGIFAGGFNPSLTPSTVNFIEYVQISTLGDSLDFGDLLSNNSIMGGCSSPTRGVYCAGYSAPISISQIQSITISSKGNSIAFGNNSLARSNLTGSSNAIRGVFGGGQTPVFVNTIDYITIATFGNSVYFGDLTRIESQAVSTSSSVRAVFSGGYDSPGGTTTNIIDYVNIASTGNAIDFGDMTAVIRQHSVCSDSHGGLGGF